MIKLHNKDSLNVFYKIINENHDKNIILVSDPPFNINYKYNTYNDNMNEDEYYEMLDFYFHDLPSVVIHYPENLYKLAFQIGKFPKKVISWVYNSNTGKQRRDIAFFDIKPNDWWNINQVKNVSKEKTEHPCQMPLEVMKRIIGILPDECLIIDPFMGSGTTGVAVLEMNKKQNVKRDFIGIEIDEKYFEIAKKRIIESKGD